MEKDIISKELLDMLVCPACKQEIELIEYEKDRFGLRCAQCRCIYPICDGIPIMLVDEAIKEGD